MPATVKIDFISSGNNLRVEGGYSGHDCTGNEDELARLTLFAAMGMLDGDVQKARAALLKHCKAEDVPTTKTLIGVDEISARIAKAARVSFLAGALVGALVVIATIVMIGG